MLLAPTTMTTTTTTRKRIRTVSCACLFGTIVLSIGLYNIYIFHGFLGTEQGPQRTLIDTTSRPPSRTSTQAVSCQNARGVLHIQMADIEGGVGTALFQLILAQLHYAKQHQLIPFVHLQPNISRVIDVGDNGKRINWHVAHQATISKVQGLHWRDVTPGAPDWDHLLPSTTIQLKGSGIWNLYFEPVSNFDRNHPDCQKLPYVTMDEANIGLIIPGLHGLSKDAIRCWRYDYLPEYVRRPHQSYHKWIARSRQRAHSILEHYQIQLKDYLLRQTVDTKGCLGLHVRHSDKAAGRRLVDTDEFLPYAQAFVDAGGPCLYLATDSTRVLQHIQTTWPSNISNRLRTAPSMVRSTNTTAVFDLTQTSHHQVNQEAIVEILNLAGCEYLVHGHSAVSEAAIWHHGGRLHNQSVNLEDPDHLSVKEFVKLLNYASVSAPRFSRPQPIRAEEAWMEIARPAEKQRRLPTHDVCQNSNGVLLIQYVSSTDSTASGIFNSILNQLLFAERHNLKPWVSLDPTHRTPIFDNARHYASPQSLAPMTRKQSIIMSIDKSGQSHVVGFSKERSVLLESTYQVNTSKVWETYFEPVSDFAPGDESCDTLVQFEQQQVESGLRSAPWAIQAWQYDESSDTIPSKRLEAMRIEAGRLIKKHIRFQPYLQERASDVQAGDSKCLSVHIRMADKQGKNRRKVKLDEYVPYIEAFVKAGGQSIYLATDTQRPLQYIAKSFPDRLKNMIRTQGDHIVRSTTGDYPTLMLDDAHRVNVETLVDVLALSKCSVLLHSYSTVAEAAIYLNPTLHNNSVNLEATDRISTEEFELLCRYVLGVDKELQNVSGGRALQDPRVLHDEEGGRRCSNNAIVYLAQKKHSSYDRDSYQSLLRSLRLLQKNYLSQGRNVDNVDVFVFHTGDFNVTDLTVIEGVLGGIQGLVKLVDLSYTEFWSRPAANKDDNPSSWYAYPLFSEGYRRMMHWFAIDIWRFFAKLNVKTGCKYRYLFRLDEDSFLHSPIRYDIFNYMNRNEFVYGFRMCAYEMKVTQRMSKLWIKRHASFVPERELSLDMCGFYNNFFVADLQYFLSAPVQSFLQFIDNQGHIYRRRLGDLMIHSMAVYWFAKPHSIHRFLDFTYEHSTLNSTNGCVVWGGMQAGYDDANAVHTVNEFRSKMKGCEFRLSDLSPKDLSPTYQHIDSKSQFASLATVTMGNVELPQQGMLSG